MAGSGAWEAPGQGFPLTTNSFRKKRKGLYRQGKTPRSSAASFAWVLLVFPGTNGEYETAEMFRQAGSVVRSLVFRDLTIAEIKSSLADLSKAFWTPRFWSYRVVSAGDDGRAGNSSTGLSPSPGGRGTHGILGRKRGLILGIGNGLGSGQVGCCLMEIGLWGRVPSFDRKPNWQASFSVCKDQIVSTLSPWFSNVQVGQVYAVPLPAGRDVLWPAREMEELLTRGQIATQYID